MSKIRNGVVFNEDDYANMLSRIIVMVIDLFLVSIIFVTGYLIDLYLYQGYYTDSFVNALYVSLMISYLYLTVMKSSRIGTLGQIVTKTKILNIEGSRPDIFQMTFRLLFWAVGPVNLIFDIAWLSLNKEKRTMRDSMCNTIIVKRDALPITDDSAIRNIRVMVFGFHFLYDTANP